MNYNQFFKEELNKLKAEGNYRVFADLENIGNYQTQNYKEDKKLRLYRRNDVSVEPKEIVIQKMINATKKLCRGNQKQSELIIIMFY